MSIDRPRRRLRPSERRAEILDTASTLLSARGYRGFTLSELAEHSGITRAGLSHHFGSKEAVFVALLERRDELDLTENGITKGTYPANAEEFTAALERVVERNLHQPEIARMYAGLGAEAVAPEHPAHDYFVARLTALRTELARGAARWHTDPEALALEVHSFLEGLLMSWLLDPRIDMKSAYRKFAQRFVPQEQS